MNEEVCSADLRAIAGKGPYNNIEVYTCTVNMSFSLPIEATRGRNRGHDHSYLDAQLLSSKDPSDVKSLKNQNCDLRAQQQH